MSMNQRLRQLIRSYRDETGKREWTSRDVVVFAMEKNWIKFDFPHHVDLFATQVSLAARGEIRHDAKTGLPYRVYHDYTVRKGRRRIQRWGDIDEMPRSAILKALIRRRNLIRRHSFCMAGDVHEVRLDLDHWNAVHAEEGPIRFRLELGRRGERRKGGFEGRGELGPTPSPRP